MSISNWLTRQWAKRKPRLILRVFALFFGWLVRLRRYYYRRAGTYIAPLPVIVVGNISLGGTGKTQFIIWLVGYLQQQQYRVGVVSRGYGRRTKGPLLVQLDMQAEQCGDEPLLVARTTGVQVAVASKRVLACRLLIAHYDLDVIISDDGLQHYALKRDIEIVLHNPAQLANQYLLPAGRLREPVARLQEADLVVAKNGAASVPSFHYQAQCWVSATGKSWPLEHLRGQPVVALAGIAHNDEFFAELENLGLELRQTIALPDHQGLSDAVMGQLAKLNYPVVMTAKDAVKLPRQLDFDYYVLKIQLIASGSLQTQLDSLLTKHLAHRSASFSEAPSYDE